MNGADYFLFFLGLIWVVVATVFDIRKREVPNWLNFSLILFALAFRYFYGVFNGINYFIYGGLGFILFFGLAHVFYYGRVFAGGDAKLLMGLGAVLPLFEGYAGNVKMLLYFIFVFMVLGSLYGLVYSLALAAGSFQKFAGEFKKQIFQKRRIFYFSTFFVILFGILAFYLGGISWLLPLILFLMPFLYIYAKSVEEVCMVAALSPLKVSEGDWLYQPIKIGNKMVYPRWEGLHAAEVQLIQTYGKKRILVKQGIPFIPAFLIAYLFFFCVFFFRVFSIDLNTF